MRIQRKYVLSTLYKRYFISLRERLNSVNFSDLNERKGAGELINRVAGGLSEYWVNFGEKT